MQLENVEKSKGAFTTHVNVSDYVCINSDILCQNYHFLSVRFNRLVWYLYLVSDWKASLQPLVYTLRPVRPSDSVLQLALFHAKIQSLPKMSLKKIDHIKF